MMRQGLKRLEGRRVRFVAQYERMGRRIIDEKRADKTVLLVNVCDEQGNLLCDHVWMHRSIQFEKAKLKKGDMITFTGEVSAYRKGYKGFKIGVRHTPKMKDYKIVRLRGVTKL